MADPTLESAVARARTTGSPGPGRALGLAYAFFSLAAGARSGVQLGTQAADAPLAYGLSAVAAALYLVGTVVVIAVESRRWSPTAAIAACAAELIGVLVVGALSIGFPDSFPDATVWSRFGAGYVWIPLLLPILGLAWAATLRSGPAHAAAGPPRPRASTSTGPDSPGVPPTPAG